jgi:hypothetical protein
MKRFIFVATILGLTIVALRRFGPTMGRRAMTKCQEMMARYQGQPGEAPCAELRDEPTELASTPA